MHTSFDLAIPSVDFSWFICTLQLHSVLLWLIFIIFISTFPQLIETFQKIVFQISSNIMVHHAHPDIVFVLLLLSDIRFHIGLGFWKILSKTWSLTALTLDRQTWTSSFSQPVEVTSPRIYFCKHILYVQIIWYRNSHSNIHVCKKMIHGNKSFTCIQDGNLKSNMINLPWIFWCLV